MAHWKFICKAEYSLFLEEIPSSQITKKITFLYYEMITKLAISVLLCTKKEVQIKVGFSILQTFILKFRALKLYIPLIFSGSSH